MLHSCFDTSAKSLPPMKQRQGLNLVRYMRKWEKCEYAFLREHKEWGPMFTADQVRSEVLLKVRKMINNKKQQAKGIHQKIINIL